jgi:hypothetical protein
MIASNICTLLREVILFLCSPVVHAYALVTDSSAVLYIGPAKLTEEVTQHLKGNGVTIKPYQGRAVLDDLAVFRSGE